MTRTVAVILAGGEARRLGGIDKTLILLGGTPVLAVILERLRRQVATIALSANGDPARFRAFELPVIADRRIGIGPLGGLQRAFEWADEQGADALLTLPGDTPFIPRDLLARLSPAPAVACSAGRRHHLVALWPVGWRAALDAYLAALDPAPARAPGVRAFAAPFGMREVQFTEQPDPFLNLNTPDDVAAAGGMNDSGRPGADRQAGEKQA